MASGFLGKTDFLDADLLRQAYAQGAFPWCNHDQPVLWWSPDPRMVLYPSEVRLYRSLRQLIKAKVFSNTWQIRFNTAFAQVMHACANSGTRLHKGTWIDARFIEAYCHLHRQGLAHSVEVWQSDALIGGLYCVALGRAVFGESMFSIVPNASKVALAALCAFCLEMGVGLIDCQQRTEHLAFLGARDIGRADFLTHLAHAQEQASLDWSFSSHYWHRLHPSLHRY